MQDSYASFISTEDISATRPKQGESAAAGEEVARRKDLQVSGPSWFEMQERLG